MLLHTEAFEECLCMTFYGPELKLFCFWHQAHDGIELCLLQTFTDISLVKYCDICHIRHQGTDLFWTIYEQIPFLLEILFASRDFFSPSKLPKILQNQGAISYNCQ